MVLEWSDLAPGGKVKVIYVLNSHIFDIYTIIMIFIKRANVIKVCLLFKVVDSVSRFFGAERV